RRRRAGRGRRGGRRHHPRRGRRRRRRCWWRNRWVPVRQRRGQQRLLCWKGLRKCISGIEGRYDTWLGLA
ncbi:hypothetical protein NJB1907E19_19890, partial [Mycobacterium marinum]